MFGNLGISRRFLNCRGRQAYNAHFCAACHLMADFGGRPAALWMNYDLTFLVVLLNSLEAEPRAPVPLRCTALPWRSVKVQPLSAWGRATLAAVNLALLGAKLEDDRQDEGGLRRWLASAWLSRYRRRVEDVLSRSGFPLEEVLTLPQRQTEVESRPAGLSELSAPTARVIGTILAHTATLACRPELAGELRRLGECLGRFLYLLDAAQDLEQDLRRGRFNAFAHALGRGGYSGEVLQAALGDLRDALMPLSGLRPLGQLAGPLLRSLQEKIPGGAEPPKTLQVASFHASGPGGERGSVGLTRHRMRRAGMVSVQNCDCGNCDCGGDCGGCDDCCKGCNACDDCGKACHGCDDCCKAPGHGSGCGTLCSPCDACDCCCWTADSASQAGTSTAAPPPKPAQPQSPEPPSAPLPPESPGSSSRSRYHNPSPMFTGESSDPLGSPALRRLWDLAVAPPCPSCGPAQGMGKRGVHSIEVDCCPRCEGVWLDQGELSALKELRRLPNWLVTPTAPGFTPVPAGKRQCPGCRKLLEVERLAGVQVDLCRECQGMWLDRGELNLVLRGLS